jgi:CHAT domain-containing protein/Tfp pilus assembly protein PilF
MTSRLLALASFAVALAGTSPTERWMQANDSLTPGVSLERELRDGESHRYNLTLPADHYIHIRVIEKKIILSLEILSPEGARIAKAERPNVYFGPKSLHVITSASGVYRLVCQSTDDDSRPGRFSIFWAASRLATDRERRLIRSQTAYSEALGFLRGKSPDRRQATEKLLTALEEARGAEDQELQALALTHLGLTEYELRRYAEAENWYLQAIAVWQALGDKQGEGRATNNLGAVFSRQSALHKAKPLYEQALACWRESGDFNGQGRATFNIGTIHQQSGERQQALDWYEAAIGMYQQGGAREPIAGVWNTIGLLYFEMGETQRALDFYARVLSFFRAAVERNPDVNRETEISRVLNDLGEVYASMGREKEAEALSHFTQALAIREKTGDKYEAAMTLANLGLFHASAGRDGEARDCYERALAYARETRYRSLEAATLGHLGELMAPADPGKSRDLYRASLALNRELNRRDAEALTLYRLARLDLHQGYLVDARASIESAISLSEESRATIASQQLRSSFFATKQDYFELYIDVLMRMHGQMPGAGYDRLAIQASERSRTRSLLELLAETQVRLKTKSDPGLSDNAEALRRQIVQQSNHHFTLLRSRSSQPQEVAETEERIRSLTAEYDQAVTKMRAANPDYAALTAPRPLDWAQIQAQLDRDSILLQYSLGADRSYLWAVSSDSIERHVLPPRQQVKEAALRLYESLIAHQPRPGDRQNPKQRFERERNADREVWPRAAHLASMLLGPVAEKLAGKRLVIVPDGALQIVPFNVLPVPRQVAAVLGGGLKEMPPVPLIVEHEIVYLPSVSTLSQQRKAPGAAGYTSRQIALFADPVFSAENPRTIAGERSPVRASPGRETPARAYHRDGLSLGWLKYSAQEAANIEALSNRKASLFARRFDASRDAVLHAELKRYPIIHFSTHALFNDQHPALTGIVLSLYDRRGRQREGFLPLHDIYNLELAADLVVLSACQTALGREIRGEGMIGLTRGFFHSGARRVVSSLWMVDDSTTCDLMTRFYAAMWRQGKTPAAALREAQIGLWRQLSNQPEKQSPYFWGGFILQGDWR